MAGFVVENDDSANHEILAYGFGLIISGIATYIALFGSALIFGVIYEMLIAISIYSIMRLTIGGSHAKTKAICFIVYSSVLYLSIFLSTVVIFNLFAKAILYGVNVILLIQYAPSDTVQQPIVKRRFARKILGLVFLSLFFGISLLIREMQTEANILLLIPTLTCVFLHPFIYRISGCEK